MRALAQLPASLEPSRSARWLGVSWPDASLRPAPPLQAWWEKWGEQYDTRGGSVFKWTDKWAESGAGVRWGDKWEERFESSGKGTRQGETWRVSSTGDRWSRTWGESHGTQCVPLPRPAAPKRTTVVPAAHPGSAATLQRRHPLASSAERALTFILRPDLQGGRAQVRQEHERRAVGQHLLFGAEIHVRSLRAAWRECAGCGYARSAGGIGLMFATVAGAQVGEADDLARGPRSVAAASGDRDASAK